MAALTSTEGHTIMCVLNPTGSTSYFPTSIKDKFEMTIYETFLNFYFASHIDG